MSVYLNHQSMTQDAAVGGGREGGREGGGGGGARRIQKVQGCKNKLPMEKHLSKNSLT